MSEIASKRSQEETNALSINADRLIIATNRGPIEYYLTRDHQLKNRRGAGGVVTALTGTVSQVKSTWVALAMTEGDREALKNAHDGILQSHKRDIPVQLRYVSVPKAVYHRHYDMMSNRVLWFTQHYLLGQEADIPSGEKLQYVWDHGYHKVNAAIAEAVIAEIEREPSKALVMLHDYHLYLASAMIRERHPGIAMQQFIHIPWPEIRYWVSSLPTSITQAIFEGLLGNDILGFQTRRDAQNFLDGVHSLLDEAEVNMEQREIIWKGHHVFVRDYPISISVEGERKLVRSNPGKRAAEQIKPLLAKHTIMRVDRVDPAKNIVVGFQAYDALLEQHPELHGQVKFLAFMVPSRQSLPVYRKYQEEAFKLIDEINKKYGNKEWQPIYAFVQNDRTMALSALQFYDVLLVNSLIDGMNLVAKEGPVVNKTHGVLVLSRTSGASQQLESASILVSPSDVQETADALYKALLLPDEERQHLAQLAREEVERNNLHTWIMRQIDDINDLLTQR
jgi:trehalose 6-phosphate synthase